MQAPAALPVDQTTDWGDWPTTPGRPRALVVRDKLIKIFERHAGTCIQRSNTLGYKLWMDAAEEVHRQFATFQTDFDPTVP